MAPHLTPDELGMITVCAAKKVSAEDMREAITKRRAPQKIVPARYVPLKEITASSLAPCVHPTTVARYLREKGVTWRRKREKPPRTGAHDADNNIVASTPC